MDDPDTRVERRERRESAIIRRERVLEAARRLINRAKLSGNYRIPGPGGYSTVFVMRPETLDFILRGQGALHEGRKEFAMGERPLLDRTPVYFSEDLDIDQVILAYDGWPYFGRKDFEKPDEF